jgi:hypothetical protein
MDKFVHASAAAGAPTAVITGWRADSASGTCPGVFLEGRKFDDRVESAGMYDRNVRMWCSRPSGCRRAYAWNQA